MKSSQSNFNLRSPGSYLVRSYLITTVSKMNVFHLGKLKNQNLGCQQISTTNPAQM